MARHEADVFLGHSHVEHARNELPHAFHGRWKGVDPEVSAEDEMFGAHFLDLIRDHLDPSRDLAWKAFVQGPPFRLHVIMGFRDARRVRVGGQGPFEISSGLGSPLLKNDNYETLFHFLNEPISFVNRFPLRGSG